MYARANMFTADPAKLEDGIRYVGDNVIPMVNAVPGNVGLAMTVDRDTGEGAVVTFWDSMESLRASEDAVKSVRDEAGQILGGSLQPQVLEIAEQQVREMPRPGCSSRVTMVEMAPTEVDKSLDVFRTSTIPALDALDGFCAAMMGADRETGRCVAITTWRDRAAMEASRERAAGLRQEVADKAQGTVSSVAEVEVVHFVLNAR